MKTLTNISKMNINLKQKAMKRLMIIISVLFAVALMASSSVERVEENNGEDFYYMMFCNECGWEWSTPCGELEDNACPDCQSPSVYSFPVECGELTVDFMWIWQCDQGHDGKCEINEDQIYCWQKITYIYPTWRCPLCGYGEGYVTWYKVILDGEGID